MDLAVIDMYYDVNHPILFNASRRIHPKTNTISVSTPADLVLLNTRIFLARNSSIPAGTKKYIPRS
jgi:hypothetical protein